MNARICSDCNSHIPEGAPLDMCPRCLLQGAKAYLTLTGRNGRELGAPPAAEELESLLAGRFRVDGLIGRGGMGAVYRAQQVRIDRPVAIKLLPRQDDDQDPEFPARFLREARALAMLNHPNIVTLFDYGEVGGHFYFVMEYVEGASLEQNLRDGPLSLEDTRKIVLQVCRALQFAHDQGVVHRDVKPGNILITREGNVKMVDFGLAKLADSKEASLSLTWQNQPMGTPFYMAPEQRGNPLAADHRADIYGLGVVIYEMLTSELPTGKFPPPSQLATVGKKCDAIVFKALEFDPARRYRSVLELSDDFSSGCKDLPQARSPKRSLLYATTAIAMFLGAVGLFLFESFGDSSLSEDAQQLNEGEFSTGLPTGKILGFGSNIYNQVTLAGSMTGNDFVAVAAGDAYGVEGGFILGLKSNGKVVGAGGPDAPQVPVDLGRVVAIDAGASHGLALTADNRAVEWGRFQPQMPENMPDVWQISASGDLSAAVTTTGKVIAWGTTRGGKNVLFEDPINRDILRVVATPYAIMALNKNQQILVRGDASSPIVHGFKNPGHPTLLIAGGNEYGVAMFRESKLWEWGWGPLYPENSPEGSGDFHKLISGPYTSAVQRDDGSWAAWGELASFLPGEAAHALSLDFGFHSGVAVILADAEPSASLPPPLSMEETANFGEHESEIQQMVFDRVNGLLWTMTDLTVRAFSIESRTQVKKPFIVSGQIHMMTYCPVRRAILLACDGGQIHILHTSTFPTVTGSLRTESTSPVASITCSQDGSLIAAGDGEGQLFVWRADEPSPQRRIKCHTAPLTGIAISADNERVFTASWDRTVKETRLAESPSTEQILATVDKGQNVALHFKDGLLVVSDWGGFVRLWDSEARNPGQFWFTHASGWDQPSFWLNTNASPRIPLDFSASGRFLSTCGGDRQLRIWDLEGFSLVARMPAPSEHPIHALAFVANDQIACEGENHSITIWKIPEFADQ